MIGPDKAYKVTQQASSFAAARIRMQWSRPGTMRIEVGLWPGLETWTDRVKCRIQQELSHHVGGKQYEVLVLTSEEFERNA